MLLPLTHQSTYYLQQFSNLHIANMQCIKIRACPTARPVPATLRRVALVSSPHRSQCSTTCRGIGGDGELDVGAVCQCVLTVHSNFHGSVCKVCILGVSVLSGMLHAQDKSHINKDTPQTHAWVDTLVGDDLVQCQNRTSLQRCIC